MIEDVGDSQWEGVAYKVWEEEEGHLSLYCRAFSAFIRDEA
jgi:hypothetical protein